MSAAAAHQRRRTPYIDDEEVEAELLDSPAFDQVTSSAPGRRSSTMRRDDSDGSRGSSASSSRKYSDRRPSADALAPPTWNDEEDEDAWEYVAADGTRHKRYGASATAAAGHGGWHYAPLAIALAPPLGALLGGSADSWTDAILVLLSGFWLYQFLKVPHDIYRAARTRRVLQEDALDDVDTTSPDGTPQRRLPTEAQLSAMAELRRTEIFALIACVASPLVGAKMLEWVMMNLEDGSRFLNKFNIRLFMLAAGIKPWTHAFSLLRRRILHLQDTVHYPSLKVESLTRRLNRLEDEHASLRKLVALKTDVRMLRDGIDVPLTQLSRTLRRYEKKEENLRLNAEDKFALMEGRFEDLLREVAVNAELISMLERQQAESSSFPASILNAIKIVLGQRSELQQQRHYLQNMPRALPSTASLGITGPAAGGVHSADSSSPTSSTGSPPYRAKSLGGAMSQHQAPPQSYSSPPRYHGPMPPPTTKSATSPSWYQSGLAYWALLPLNISSAVLQTAKEKVASPALHHYQPQQHKLEASPFLAPPQQLQQPSIVVQPAQNSSQPPLQQRRDRERERDRERHLSPTGGIPPQLQQQQQQQQQPLSPSGGSVHRRKSIKTNGSRRM